MLTPTDQLHNLRDSLMTARAKYEEDGDVEVRFATPKQVQAISIALGKIVPEAKQRQSRIVLLAYIAGRDPRYFQSSKDFTFEEASALIDRLYETTGDETSLADAQMREEVTDAIRQAWTDLTSEDKGDAPYQRKM